MYKPVHIERGVQRLADNYVIEMLHITKEFPGIKANDDITLQLRKGEIHAPFNVYGLVHKFLYYIIQKNRAMYNRICTKSSRNLAKQNKNRPARGAQGG